MLIKRRPASNLASIKSLYLTDYENKYALTKALRDFDLIPPCAEELEAGWNAIKQRLVLSRSTFNETITALLAGKHVILYGPPGTGKTTLSEYVASTMKCGATLRTASAEWSTYDTVGGLRVSSHRGRETLVPFDGAVIQAVVECCNQIGRHKGDSAAKQAVWLIIDELNRAKMDAAFGQFFTALDERQGQVALDHYHDIPLNRCIHVPRRFRIIGTMNNYDKNLLFQMSYALTRRFAFVYVGAPTKEQFAEEKLFVWNSGKEQLNEKLGVTLEAANFSTRHKIAFDQISAFIARLRGYDVTSGDQMTREIGTAQFLDAFRHAVFARELHDYDPLVSADEAIAVHIAPQLDGLGSDLESLAAEDVLKNLPRTRRSLIQYSRFGL